MPQAVTHILIALIIAELIRDYLVKDKKKFPLHYVLIAGVAGLLPDIDVALYWILYFFRYTLSEVHRTFTHTIFLPALFLIFAGVFWKVKIRELGKHHLKLHNIFLVVALGALIHLILDFVLSGVIRPLYPFFISEYGLNLVSFLPVPLNDIALPCLDAALLVLWLISIEVRHKISRFI